MPQLLLGFPFPKSSIEVQHILALGIWGRGLQEAILNWTMRIILQKTANSSNMIKYVPHLTGKLLPVTLNT